MSSITLIVIAHQGLAADGSLRAEFGACGGTVGRADSCDLVLPDPGRSVSRVHAQLLWRKGRCYVIDRGSNPVLVNGQPVGVECEWPLADGDLLQLGGYTLRASQGWLPTVDHARAQATVAAPVPEAAELKALYMALLQGLAVPDLKLPPLTPELMLRLGRLLRESAAGTVELLVARAALKHELRTDSTMIVAHDNNPLKFSPSADVALQHLLTPPARGFMDAVPALREAHADLCAHQFGVIAGMRAALEGVLDRFDPEALEARLAPGSMLDKLLPGSRKARLWELLVEHHAQIREEASVDFHTLFGRAFVQAYEAHISALSAKGA